MRRFAVAAAALIILAFSCAAPGAAQHDGPPKGLREVSVTVIANDGGRGSATIFVDADGTNWALTAAHVTRPDAAKVQLHQVTQAMDGNHAEVTVTATIAKHSTAFDLCLLRVDKAIWKTGATLHTGPPHGLDCRIWHCGTLMGRESHSVTGGYVNGIGEHIAGQLLDRGDFTAEPGSSGGGVFCKDGHFIGVVVRGRGQRVVWYVPLREVQRWAKEEGIKALMGAKDKAAPPGDCCGCCCKCGGSCGKAGCKCGPPRMPEVK